MCFIKIGDPLSPCDHEDCKKTLQALQMSNCLYNSQPKFNPTQLLFKPQPQYQPKRPREENQNTFEEQTMKKVKIDESSNEKKSEEVAPNNEDYLMKLFNMQQQKMPQNNGVIHPQMNLVGIKTQPQNMNVNNNENLLAYLLLNNTTGKQNMFLDMNQQHEPLLNMGFNVQQQFGNGFENGGSGGQNTCSKEFLNKVYMVLTAQNKIILEIKEKNNLLFDNLVKLSQEFSEFRNLVLKQDSSPTERVSPNDSYDKKDSSSFTIPIPLSGENINAKSLLNCLYGAKQEKFMFKLKLNSEFELPLYKERNFSFSIALIDMHDNRVVNTNRIPISVALYTYENPPKCLDNNTSGSKILKGNIEKDLVNGYCSFEKIQIKDVTSHFRKKYVFIVVYPKMPTFGNLSSGVVQENFIDFSSIKPLVLEKVVVKAKKINSQKMNGNMENAESKEEENENESQKEGEEERVVEKLEESESG